MPIKLKVENLRGIFQVVVDLGLGRRPRNTTTDKIRDSFMNIQGVTVRNAAGFKIHEGVWALTRPDLDFSTAELEAIRKVAEAIADRG